VYVDTGDGQVYIDPDIVAQSGTPNPVFEKGWQHELIVPATGEMPGPGNWVHVLFKTNPQVTNAQGQVLVTGIKIHADVGNPGDVLGLLRHIASDILIARANSSAQGGCAVKLF
jgi:hypothetical protein